MRSMQKLRREVQELIDEQESCRAIVAQLQATASGTPDEREVAAVAARWCRLWEQSMADHCRGEEGRLLVWLPGSPLVERLYREHDQLRELTAALAVTPTAALLGALAEAMRAHLDWEGEELLPAVMAAMGVTAT